MTIRLRRLALTVLTGAATAACGEAAPRADVERTDSAGIEVVTNRAADRELGWRFERILDLGGDVTGEKAFHRVHSTSIGTDGNGNLHVLDAGAHRVTVFDRQGAVLRSYGGQGRGPGEFGFPSDLAVADDGATAIYDFASRGFARFAADGSVLPVVTVAGALQRKLAITVEGRLLGAFQHARSEADTLLLTRLLSIGPADTLELAVLASPNPRDVSFDCMGLSLPPFLAPAIVWAAAGARVVIATGADYSLAVLDAGRPTGSWRRALAPLPATVQLAAAELPSDSFRMMGGAGRCAVSSVQAAERIGYAELAPHVKDIVVARNGEVWVLRRTAEPRETRIDLLSADGEYVGTLPRGTPFPAAFFSADEIVTVETDSLDLPHVRAYCILRN
jgi:hypothetical protein